MARLSCGSPDDALDIVQDTMLNFVRLYAGRPEGEWNVLFYKILHSRITDWYRRTAVRRRFHDWFGKPRDEEADLVESGNLIKNKGGDGRLSH